ncbi:MAG: hypothetical protein AB7H77_08660 [Bdellovibrionales bacterium]
MTREISPVLAGTFDAHNYAPANINANAASSEPATKIDDLSGPDSRRYTHFDHSVTECGSTTDFSFGDLLDLINPLEHIPIVSSIYRSITGDEIHPVSRVAGDILYGGLIGMASAVLGGLGAIGDTQLASSTGKDSSGHVIAALFGPDESKATVQLASAENTGAVRATPEAPKEIDVADSTTAEPKLAALTISSSSPPAPLAVPRVPVTTSKDETGPAPKDMPKDRTGVIPDSSPPAEAATEPRLPAPASVSSAGIPLPAAGKNALGKLAFGGIMGTTPEQEMAVALAQGTPGIRMGNKIYPGQLSRSGGLKPMLAAGIPGKAPSPSLPSPTPPLETGFSGGMSPIPSGTLLPSALANNALMLKALDQYRNIAAGRSGAAGRQHDLTN